MADRRRCVDQNEYSKIPEYGWRIKLDHVYSHKPQAFSIPRWSQIPKLVGMGLRYMRYAHKERKKGKRPFIDPYAACPCRQVFGVPLGGIGCGSIGRGWKGDFNRWQLKPGMYTYECMEGNQFTVCIRKRGRTVYQHVLSPNRPNGYMCGKSMQGWQWGFNGSCATYHALYPRAWTTYDIPGQKVRLVCRQISPIFPDNYKDTSLPVAVFVWTVENLGDEQIEVTIMLTFQNDDGSPDIGEGGWGHYNEPFTSKGIFTEVHCDENSHTDQDNDRLDNGVSCDLHGVLLHHKHPSLPCTFAIGAKAKHENGKDIVKVTTKTSFDCKTPCKRLWEDLMDDGLLTSTPEQGPKSRPDQALAAAVAAKVIVAPSGKGEMEFVLAWDMPVIHFGRNSKKYYRRYTRFFGTRREAGPALCSYALIMYPEWEQKIYEWQNPILQDETLPNWYKSALFNELYFIADGGTVWVDVSKENSKLSKLPEVVKKYGRFAYLEGHEYRMYNTYDVHFYASFALAMLWPNLQLSLQYDMAQTVNFMDNEIRMTMMNGRHTMRKFPGCIPHDLGDPDDEPWLRINAYTIHDTSEWKDLNVKFVLQIFRDYVKTEDVVFLQEMWPVAKTVMTKAVTMDVDDDGLIDNSGFADQTFDTWIVTGASAYCGGLWLAALRIMCEIANILGFPEEFQKYRSILERGKKSYELKLWNGRYYDYDSSSSKYHNSIMADQLAGHLYLSSCGLTSDPQNRVFPEGHVKSALKTVFKYNVMRFQGGEMGAVNGMRPDGKVDTSSLQAEEVWTGVTYSVAATMIQEGLIREGFKTASGIYHTCFERLGMHFQTPEAFIANGNYRSLAYMRPLSIWAIQWALEQRKGKTPVDQDDEESSEDSVVSLEKPVEETSVELIDSENSTGSVDNSEDYAGSMDSEYAPESTEQSMTSLDSENANDTESTPVTKTLQKSKQIRSTKESKELSQMSVETAVVNYSQIVESNVETVDKSNNLDKGNNENGNEEGDVKTVDSNKDVDIGNGENLAEGNSETIHSNGNVADTGNSENQNDGGNADTVGNSKSLDIRNGEILNEEENNIKTVDDSESLNNGKGNNERLSVGIIDNEGIVDSENDVSGLVESADIRTDEAISKNDTVEPVVKGFVETDV